MKVCIFGAICPHCGLTCATVIDHTTEPPQQGCPWMCEGCGVVGILDSDAGGSWVIRKATREENAVISMRTDIAEVRHQWRQARDPLTATALADRRKAREC